MRRPVERPQPGGQAAILPAGTADLAGALLTVNLGAVRENYRLLKSKLGGTACAGVVKADGYGLGADKVARALQAEGCDTFFVALASEGISLRRALGPAPTIYVLNGVAPGAEEAVARAGLVAVLNSLDQLAAWAEAGKRLGKKLPAALQVDSGMSRLGMAPAEVEALARDAGLLTGIELKLVMSHLACADEPTHPANAAQLAAFRTLRAKLPAAPASLANSSGVFLGPEYHFDLARPGAALYGINPTPGSNNPMRAVVTLRAKVVQTREVPAGAAIGYGHAATAAEPKRLATISLGYADGWQRRAGAAAWFDGKRLPFIGRVSMDSIILDVSSVPAGVLKTGDLVSLIDGEHGVDDAAVAAGTIGYEVLTGLGSRFERTYTG